jgi:hypothetical protein
MKPNSRERQIRKSRKLVTDEQLIAILRALYTSPEVHTEAVGTINTQFDEGITLDQCFYTGSTGGYELEITRLGEARLEFHFGWVAPEPVLAGDGGYWNIEFDAAGNVRDGPQSFRIFTSRPLCIDL